MPFIPLTLSEDGSIVFINYNQIEYLTPDPDDPTLTLVAIPGDDYLVVKESIDAIVAMVERIK